MQRLGKHFDSKMKYGGHDMEPGWTKVLCSPVEPSNQLYLSTQTWLPDYDESMERWNINRKISRPYQRIWKHSKISSKLGGLNKRPRFLSKYVFNQLLYVWD